MFVFTIYHSQSNDQFERTNQTIKIVLRYWIIANFEIDFDQELLYVQTSINNIVVTIIEYTSNELYYEFRLQNNLKLLTNMSIENWNVLRLKYRENIEKTIAWINIIIKFNYDRRYIFLNLIKNFKTYLRLHYDYTISSIINKKLSQQRVDFFIILNKIDNLIYRLNLSSIIIIYLVVFVTQLKFLFVDSNFYRRSRFDDENFSSMITKNNDSIFYYEIERLLDRRISRDKIQYFVKWKKYESIYNVWYNNDDFVNIQKLIDNYEKIVANKFELSTRTRRMKMLFDSNDDAMIIKKLDRYTWKWKIFITTMRISSFFLTMTNVTNLTFDK